MYDLPMSAQNDASESESLLEEEEQQLACDSASGIVKREG